MTTILLTNDDGYDSAGITALFKSLQKLGDVIMVAPDRDNSAVSHSLTMHRPLRLKMITPEMYSLDGTPADCVAIGTQKVLRKKPELLVSGINSGPNLGDDISYSGTVSAAIEGTMYSIPSLAFSMIDKKSDFSTGAEIAAQIASLTISQGLPENTLLNVNIPAEDDLQGVRITRQGRKLWSNAIQETTDPWGEKIFWIGGGTSVSDSAADTDVRAVAEGYVSITPIHLDKTNHEGIFQLRKSWSLERISLP